MEEKERSVTRRRRFPSLLEAFFSPEEFYPDVPFSEEAGLSVSEDDKNFFVEASLPGIQPNEIQVNIEKGTLWIKGDKIEKEEDKKRKFYRKARNTFSYFLSLPENVDLNQEPKAVTKNGIMTISFPKKEQTQARRINVQAG